MRDVARIAAFLLGVIAVVGTLTGQSDALPGGAPETSDPTKSSYDPDAAARLVAAVDRLRSAYKCRSCDGTRQVERERTKGEEKGKTFKRRIVEKVKVDCEACEATGYAPVERLTMLLKGVAMEAAKVDPSSRGGVETLPRMRAVMREVLSLNSSGLAKVINPGAADALETKNKGEWVVFVGKSHGLPLPRDGEFELDRPGVVVYLDGAANLPTRYVSSVLCAGMIDGEHRQDVVLLRSSLCIVPR